MKKIVHKFKNNKQKILSMVILFIFVFTGTNYMNANIEKGTPEVTNKFLNKVKDFNSERILTLNKKILLISSEAIIKEKIEEKIELSSLEDNIEFKKENNLSDSLQIKFISIWKWTLITGKDAVNKDILIELEDWKTCNAKTNNNWKFWCMFSKNKLTIEDVKMNYIK